MGDVNAILENEFSNLREIVLDMKGNLKELTSAITKLTLIEERQIQASLAMERSFKAIEKIEERLAAVELLVPSNKRISALVDKATWACVGVVGTYILKHNGFF
jgi:hypothetical protein